MRRAHRLGAIRGAEPGEDRRDVVVDGAHGPVQAPRDVLTGRKAIPAAPASAAWAAGFGGNYVYVDREHDLVVVLRWIPDDAAVVSAFMESLRR